MELTIQDANNVNWSLTYPDTYVLEHTVRISESLQFKYDFGSKTFVWISEALQCMYVALI